MDDSHFLPYLLLLLLFLKDNYRKRLLISAYFPHSCTTLVYEVYASENRALISKQLRYFAQNYSNWRISDCQV